MKLLLSALLLFSVCARLSLSVSSGTIVVIQSPDVSVLEGETVEITCCWKGGSGRTRVSWLTNQTLITSETIHHHFGSVHKEISGCSNLTFRSITTEKSGRYTCRVTEEIPKLAEYEGNGTFITVTTVQDTEEDTAPRTDGGEALSPLDVFIHALRYLPLLTLLSTFFWLSKSWTKAQRRTPAAPGNELAAVRGAEEEQGEEGPGVKEPGEGGPREGEPGEEEPEVGKPGEDEEQREEGAEGTQSP